MESYQAAPPAKRMSFFEVMVKAYTSPSTTTFRGLARNPGASAGQGFLWVAVAAAISSLISFVLVRIFPSNPMWNYLDQYGLEEQFGLGQYGFNTVVGLITTLVCGVPIAMVVAVIFFAIVTGLLHLIAGLFGGSGEYSQLVYTLAAVQVPISLIGSILSPIPYLGCITFLIGLYAIVLQVLAIDGVYQFGVAKAALTWLVPFIGFCLLVACIIIAALAFLIPVFQETFQTGLLLLP